MGELETLPDELVQLARLALTDQPEDARLYLARLVRRYRTKRPELAREIEGLLRAQPTRAGGALRRASAVESPVLPVDGESRMPLLKVYQDAPTLEAPMLADNVQASLRQLIDERIHVQRLTKVGLTPTRSAIFVGSPGIGKTLSARWLAAQMRQPLYVLDLTTVMSSLLGKSGSNLRAALDFAKAQRAVLLLDEIDAIAKRRGDDSDVGELKRLVTVMLQEVESWPADGLLLAATNHPELIDPAMWRRFDLVVNFGMPSPSAVEAAIERFLEQDRLAFSKWVEVLSFVLRNDSFSDIERSIQALRRRKALGASAELVMEEFVSARATDHLDHEERKELAVLLSNETRLSQHTIAQLTGVSRDTIRKRIRAQTSER
ncbi:ATP-binding protein [Pseudoxanthomonas sangjuensis]|nr:ATPase [Pseudoxanthomonas sangjuensis]